MDWSVEHISYRAAHEGDKHGGASDWDKHNNFRLVTEFRDLMSWDCSQLFGTVIAGSANRRRGIWRHSFGR